MGYSKVLQKYSKSTPKVLQKYSKSTPKVPQKYSKSTPKVPQKYSKSTPKVLQKCPKSAPKVPQKSPKSTPKVFQKYSKSAPKVLHGFFSPDALLQIPVLSVCMFFHSDTVISVREKFPSFLSSESGKFPFIPHELWHIQLHIQSLNNSQSYSSHHSLMYFPDNPRHQNHCQYLLDLSMVHFQDQFSLLSKKSLLSIIFIIYLLSFQEFPQSLFNLSPL